MNYGDKVYFICKCTAFLPVLTRTLYCCMYISRIKMRIQPHFHTLDYKDSPSLAVRTNYICSFVFLSSLKTKEVPLVKVGRTFYEI